MRDIGQSSQSHSSVDFMLSGDGATAKCVLESFAKLNIKRMFNHVQPQPQLILAIPVKLDHFPI